MFVQEKPYTLKANESSVEGKLRMFDNIFCPLLVKRLFSVEDYTGLGIGNKTWRVTRPFAPLLMAADEALLVQALRRSNMKKCGVIQSTRQIYASYS